MEVLQKIELLKINCSPYFFFIQIKKSCKYFGDVSEREIILKLTQHYKKLCIILWQYFFFIIPPLHWRGRGYTVLPLSVCLSFRPSQDIFRRIFHSNYWWQKSDIWSQALYRYPISWEAFLDPSHSYFLFAEERGYHKWALAHSSSCFARFSFLCRICHCPWYFFFFLPLYSAFHFLGSANLTICSEALTLFAAAETG